MALSPLALVQDLSEWLAEPITEEEDVARAGRVLAAASNLVRSFTGQEWATVSEVPDPAVEVALQVAARGYTNPEGWRDERTDDWAGQGKVVPEAGLFLTPTEKTILGAYRPKVAKGIGVVATTRRGAVDTAAGWVPTQDGPLFPWY